MSVVVRAPASSANLGAGFDVLGMALDLAAEVGTGAPPPGATEIGPGHPGRAPFEELCLEFVGQCHYHSCL